MDYFSSQHGPESITKARRIILIYLVQGGHEKHQTNTNDLDNLVGGLNTFQY
jgi:hypothetical protein